MSNLIINGNFANPPSSTNNFIYYTSLTSTQQTNFYWTPTNAGTIALINGTSAFGYPSPSGQSFTQYVSFQSGGQIAQTVNIPYNGTCTLSFSYGYPTISTFPPNGIQLYFGGVLIDTLPNASSSQGWFAYSKTFNVSSGNNQLLQFIGATSSSSDIDTAVGNVSLVYTPTISSTIINPNFTIANDASYSSYSSSGYIAYDSFSLIDQLYYYWTVNDNSSNPCVFLINGALTP